MSKLDGLRAFKVNRKTGKESFHESGATIPDGTLLSYWQWSGSDLLGNTDRGVVAEYIVAMALGLAGEIGGRWDAYDLETKNGIKVEVKSSAYLQTWEQTKLSAIQFGVPRTHAWNPQSNDFAENKRRQAHIYVFAILATTDRDRIDPLDLDQWDFYVLPSATLDETRPEQKTIGLTVLVTLGARKARWRDLAREIEEAFEESRN